MREVRKEKEEGETAQQRMRREDEGFLYFNSTIPKRRRLSLMLILISVPKRRRFGIRLKKKKKKKLVTLSFYKP